MLTLDPNLTTNAAGTFGVTWDGLMQGVALPSPNAHFNLAGGYLAPTEVEAMYGGVAISELIPLNPGAPPLTPDPSLGGAIKRAADYATLTGFSVFDQNYAMINHPASPVPLATAGMQVNFYRMGSGARICVAIDPALINLYGQIITSQVSWDFAAQRIVAFSTTALPVKVLKVVPTNCMTVNYTLGSGKATWNRNGAGAVILI